MTKIFFNKQSEKSHKLFHNLKSKASHKLFHNLKSQGISVNVIIIAAIALIVLVVLIAVFTGRFGLFSKGLGSVTNICKLPGTGRDCCTSGNIITNPTGGKWSDCGDNGKCCLSGSSETGSAGTDSPTVPVGYSLTEDRFGYGI